MADRFWKSVPAAFRKPALDELYKRLRDLNYTQVDERLAVIVVVDPHPVVSCQSKNILKNFLIDMIQPDEISEELVNVGELVADEEWQIINDSEDSLQEDYSVPEREVDLEQSEIERRANTNMRVLKWMHTV